ncbi:SDR family oxidoreductase [Lysobacter korlensis]|uniref:SDR family oxidoreductase n=1 Tax=Lysobacter korlensis TaxID=553636 RepID=A0ABV6RYU4_9GAMM
MSESFGKPVVVITGASSGIGRATALRFAKSGAALMLAARGQDGLDSVAAECAELGAETETRSVDVTDEDAMLELAQQTVARFGRIDVWVNNAAVGVFGPIDELPTEAIRRVLDVNILGYVYGVRAVLPQLKRQGTGVIINVSSLTAPIPQPYTAPYSMSKAAVRSLSASVRSELRLGGHAGVRVCTVMPPAIDTPFFDNAANYTGRRARAMPPVYPPEKVARTILRLSRMPRREVIVGAIGSSFVQQGKLAPGMMERSMAAMVENTHLSKNEPVARTSGNLFAPSSASTSGSLHGGWDGGRKTAVRVGVGTVALLAGGVAVVRRLLR